MATSRGVAVLLEAWGWGIVGAGSGTRRRIGEKKKHSKGGAAAAFKREEGRSGFWDNQANPGIPGGLVKKERENACRHLIESLRTIRRKKWTIGKQGQDNERP